MRRLRSSHKGTSSALGGGSAAGSSIGGGAALAVDRGGGGGGAGGAAFHGKGGAGGCATPNGAAFHANGDAFETEDKPDETDGVTVEAFGIDAGDNIDIELEKDSRAPSRLSSDSSPSIAEVSGSIVEFENLSEK